MKKIAIAAIAMFLIACTPSTKESTGFIMPEGLKDCKVFSLFDGITRIYVTRCGFEVGTSQPGKSARHSTTIELNGKKYQEIE